MKYDPNDPNATSGLQTDPATGWKIDPNSGWPINPATGQPENPQDPSPAGRIARGNPGTADPGATGGLQGGSMANVPPPTTTTPPPTGGGGGLGNLNDPFNEQFNPPPMLGMPTAPTFNAPGYTPPPAFSYKDFTGPTATDVLNDPGYQFRLDQGEQALTNNRAAAGTFNTGSTLRDILGYGQDYASNEFQNVWGRDLTSYQTNRGNALDAYNTNYATQYRDPYMQAYTAATQANSNAMAGYQNMAANTQHVNDTNYTNAWNKYLQDYLQYRNQKLDTFNIGSWTASQ